MATLARRDRFDLVPETLRRILEGDWDGSLLRVEEYRDGDTFVVRAEVPGIDPDKDVEITVTDRTLSIKAEREERTEHRGDASYRSEFRYGSLLRTVPIPAGVTQDDVTATYRDGVLEVRVPAPADADPAPRKVPVSRV